MLRTIEATIDEHGHVTLTEPLTLPASRRAIVVILNDAPETSSNGHQPTDTAPETPPEEQQPKRERVFGSAKGQVWMSEDSEEPLELVPQRKPTFGSAKGQVSMADDFDEPLEDFKEYM